jgi:membrane protein implicated in regulation of membrane protease activity
MTVWTSHYRPCARSCEAQRAVREYNEGEGGRPMPAWIWLLFGVVLFAVELSRGDMYLLWWALAAVAAFFFAGNPAVALAVFLLFGLMLFVIVRPTVARRIMPAKHRDPPEALVGQTGVVLRQVNPQSDFAGLVDVDGRRWAARSYGSDPIPEGTEIEVLGLDGVQLLVHPVGQTLVTSGGDTRKGSSR